MCEEGVGRYAATKTPDYEVPNFEGPNPEPEKMNLLCCMHAAVVCNGVAQHPLADILGKQV